MRKAVPAALLQGPEGCCHPQRPRQYSFSHLDLPLSCTFNSRANIVHIGFEDGSIVSINPQKYKTTKKLVHNQAISENGKIVGICAPLDKFLLFTDNTTLYYKVSNSPIYEILRVNSETEWLTPRHHPLQPDQVRHPGKHCLLRGGCKQAEEVRPEFNLHQEHEPESRVGAGGRNQLLGRHSREGQ